MRYKMFCICISTSQSRINSKMKLFLRSIFLHSMLQYLLLCAYAMPPPSASQRLAPSLNVTIPARAGSWTVVPRCFTRWDYPYNTRIPLVALGNLLQRLARKPGADLDDSIHFRPSHRRLAGRYQIGACFVVIERSQGPFWPPFGTQPDYDDIFSWRDITRAAVQIHEECDLRAVPFGPVERGYGGQNSVGNGHGYAVRLGCHDAS